MSAEAARAQALAAIEAAEDMPRALDLANQALAQRHGWGDDLAGSCAAAKKWAGFLFPIAAPEAGAELRGQVLDRDLFLKVGLLAAKAVAKALLAPLPAGEGEKTRQENWARVSGAAEREAQSALACAFGDKVFAHDVFGVDSLFANSSAEWEKAAHVKAWSQMEDLLLRPHESQLATSCGVSGAEPFGAQWEASSDDFSSVAELMRQTDVGVVLAGPAGGAGVIAKGASLLRESYRQMGELTRLPNEALAMGLRGIALNLRSDARLAYHNPVISLMAFGSAPSHLGHEWTHLMDHRVQKMGTEKQKKALAELKAAPFKAEPDPELVSARRNEMVKDCREMLGFFLHTKGKADLAERHARPPKEKGGRWDCDDDFFTQISKAAAEGFEPYMEALDNARDPAKPQINREAAQWWHGEMEEAAGRNAKANAVCDFVRQAQIKDTLGHAKKGYFTSEKEMIARVGEVYFYARGAGPGVAWENLESAQPKGREAVDLARAYQHLMDELSADPEPLMSDRARQRLRDSKRPGGAASEAVENAMPEGGPGGVGLSLWRQKRSQSAGVESGCGWRARRPGL